MSLLRTSTLRAVRVASWNNARLVGSRIQGPHLPKEFNPQRDWDAVIIKFEDLKPKTENPTPNTWLIDVREPDEVMQGMIPSAVNIPLTILPESLTASREKFREQFGFEKPSRNEEVTFYCRSGVRSTSACDIAKRNGYTNILNYKGSWLEWVKETGKQ
ncbi:Rhodanese-like protein [Gymnopus androsaceus JB14]|uniref:Rhodanese-like protein n=1 Tax=Gymnopus androsaceus JB14 TaxID=1447944 RepID=A0A6A4IMX9_9AGAR|nr:Rhodanese-like protein [Gymnopus androsaceus JB14]